MALGSTQPLTEMSTRHISWGGGGEKGPLLTADNLTTSLCRSSGLVQAFTGITSLLPFIVLVLLIYTSYNAVQYVLEMCVEQFVHLQYICRVCVVGGRGGRRKFYGKVVYVNSEV